jgi:predicted NAD/FAD-binding protein
MLGLDAAQWEGLLLPWAASLNQGEVEVARGLSARSAMVFAALALPDEPLAPVEYHVLDAGMAEPLRRMRTATTRVDWRLGQPVLQLQRNGPACTVVTATGALEVDQVVLAASGEPTRALLVGLPGTAGRRAALDRIPFYDARLVLHTDPAYAQADPGLRSFLNARVEGGTCEASMDLSGVLPTGPGGTRPSLWKSWVTHRSALPAQVLNQAQFRPVLPSTGAIRAQQALNAQQGRDGLWIVGGYTKPYDAQETALLSAMEAVAALAPASARRRQLLATRAAP